MGVLHFIAVLSLLLLSVSAVPKQHHDHLHKKKPFKTGTLGTGTASAGIYPSANVTGHYRGHHHSKSEPVNAATAPVQLPSSQPPTPEKDADADTGSNAASGADEGSGEEQCNPSTVTVTTNAYVTVTVTPGTGAAAQTVPQPVISNLPTTNSQAMSSVVSSQSKNPEALETSTPQTVAAPAAQGPASPSAAGASSAPSSGNTPTSNETASGGEPVGQLPSGFKTKRGIIASSGVQNTLASQMGNYPKVAWCGDWYSFEPSQLSSNLQFVPQNYGKQSDVSGEWTRNAQKEVAEGRKYFFSFGEPGTPNAQLYMDPQDAVTLWHQKMEPYAKQGITLGAPGTLQTPGDFQWLSQFLQLCNDCSIGFLAFHWFDKAKLENVAGFKDTINKAVAMAKNVNGKQVPVWLDNFQADGTPDDQKAFLGEVVPWLDQQEEVVAYAYVPTDSSASSTNGNGFVTDGKLNDLATYYATL